MTVEITDIDKVGNFIGWVHVGGKNVSLELIEAGLGSLNFYSADKSPNLDALKRAEAAAKERKLKVFNKQKYGFLLQSLDCTDLVNIRRSC